MATATNRPKIQIDDVVREMTDDEYAAYIELTANTPQLTLPTDETPSPDA